MNKVVNSDGSSILLVYSDPPPPASTEPSSYSSTPLFYVAQCPAEGRYLVSSKDIPKSTEILECLPFSSVVSDQWSREVCWACHGFTWGKTQKIRCQGSSPSSQSSSDRQKCKVRYCSLECAQLDWKDGHSISCLLLQRLDASFARGRPSIPQIGAYEKDLMKFVIGALAKRYLFKSIAIDTKVDYSPRNRLSLAITAVEPEWDDLLQMQFNKIVDDKEEYPRLKFKIITSHLIPILESAKPSIISKDDDMKSLIEDVLYRDLANSFGTWDTSEAEIMENSEMLGFSIYPLASYFNHSCSPSVYRVRKGRKLTFFASRDIKQGEKLTISYGYTDQPVEARRNRLKECYFFDCFCEKCSKELLSS